MEQVIPLHDIIYIYIYIYIYIDIHVDTILSQGMEGGVANRALHSTKGTHLKVGTWKKLWGGGILGCHTPPILK